MVWTPNFIQDWSGTYANYIHYLLKVHYRCILPAHFMIVVTLSLLTLFDTLSPALFEQEHLYLKKHKVVFLI